MKSDFSNEFKQSIASWESLITDPESSQTKVLDSFLSEYSKTAYGKELGAPNVYSIGEYRRHFPVIEYGARSDTETPHLVQKGNLIPQYQRIFAIGNKSYSLFRNSIKTTIFLHNKH
ncbi:hypothetical protein MUP77_01905 [Candidatus Bathyarchaeota archaeon]|nr:hypothetical protein [Candidatus Bathyarchaeota archaeon]